jgi:16S rRNA (cytosine1402-N4)-methyltransferase
VNARKLRQLETTTELRDVVRAAVGFDSTTKRFSKIDAATRTFQAIRIFVNDELREISNALDGIFGILNDGARIATVAFHALEDRIVKNWAKSNENFISKINREVIRPSRAEIISNPRSRSAVLRSFRYNGDAS